MPRGHFVSTATVPAQLQQPGHEDSELAAAACDAIATVCLPR